MTGKILGCRRERHRLRGVFLVAALLWAACPLAAAARGVLPSCSWNQPGNAPYARPIPDALADYADLAPAVAARLRARMERRDYDDVAVISRDAIQGRRRYAPEIRDMHFAAGRVCHVVDRSAWPAGHEERGLVYCEGEVCVIVPTVCRNVSRIARLPDTTTPDFGGPPDESLSTRPEPGRDAIDVTPAAGPPAVPPDLQDSPPDLDTFDERFVPPTLVALPPSCGIGCAAFIPPEVTVVVPIAPPRATPPPPPLACVPEPSAGAMLLAAVVVLAGLWRRQSHRLGGSFAAGARASRRSPGRPKDCADSS